MNNFQRDINDFVFQLLKAKNPGVGDEELKRQLAGAIEKLPGPDMLRLIVMRRAMRAAGAVGEARLGYQAQTATEAGLGMRPAVASRYAAETSGPKFIEAQVKHLIESFDYGTPESGSVFWTGIDKRKLVQRIHAWNAAMGGQLFGQLEATTDAQYLDGVFKWDEDGATGQYWGKASIQLGRAAKGHVTAVQMYALQARPNAIFTHKELPAVLNGMDRQLRDGKQPDVTDITIVVLEPISDPALDARSFTNLELGSIPLVVDASDPINGFLASRARGTYKILGRLDTGIPARVLEYWRTERKGQPMSAAAQRILQDAHLLKYAKR